MVKITTQPPSVASYSPKLNKARPVEPIAPIDPERKSNIPMEKGFVERRKKEDRRKYCAARGPYDLRCGRDRRKSLRKGQFIEVDV